MRNQPGKRGAKPAARQHPSGGQLAELREVRNKARTEWKKAHADANKFGRVETYPTSKDGGVGTKLTGWAQLELEWWKAWERAQKNLGEALPAAEVVTMEGLNRQLRRVRG